MNRYVICRAILAVMLAMLLEFGVHELYTRSHEMGRDAYIAHKSAVYDRLYTRPERVVPGMIVCLIASGVFVIVYEVVGLGISKLLDGKNSDDRKGMS